MSPILRYASVFSIMISLASCGGAKHAGRAHEALPGNWQSSPIVIDGDCKDWPSPYPNYDAKAKIAYATSNDSEYLYITMETGDEMTQMKILKQGMTVSVDTGGHKNADFKISFPLQAETDLGDLPVTGQKKDNSRFEDKQREQKLNRYAHEANQFSLDGFIQCNGAFMVKQATPCGIKVRINIDEFKELVWEAAIPFSAIYNKRKISSADAGKAVSVCFSIAGYRKPDTKGSGSEGNGGGMNNGMAGAGANSSMHGGGGRGGKGGGRSSQSDNPLQHLYETTKTWKYFSLALQ